MNNLKLTATLVPLYHLKISNRTETKDLGRFSLISEWEGLSKFQDAKGNSVIASIKITGNGIFESVFNDLVKCPDKEGYVIAITPDLMPIEFADE